MERASEEEDAVAVNVEGLLTTCAGQAEALRRYADGLRAAGADVGTTTLLIGDLLPGAELELLPGPERVDRAPERSPEVNLVGINGLEMWGLVALRGAEYFERRPAVGIWAWETDEVPEPMFEHAGLLDEIWVYSDYVAANLAPHTDTPVATMPIPLAPGEPAAETGRSPELPAGFRFLFSFDFLGTVRRKNPEGVVAAFTRAFRPGEGPQLVLKAMNGDLRPDARGALIEAFEGRPDITLLDEALNPADHAELFRRCDCYVSLHRSEGFGLTLAEAMSLGMPAVATGYSGNTDFMTAENSFLVDYELTQVGPGGEHYPAGGTFAEPDVEQAAALLREIWLNPDQARRRGHRGRDEVRRSLAPEVVGAAARRRLEAIRRQSEVAAHQRPVA
jgi:glycosyltransferase involved in cell wall biosynthesis